MNVARLNFSHGNFNEHEKRIQHIRQAREEAGKTVAILLDTKGPEIRTGIFKNGVANIEKGQQINISMKDIEGTKDLFSVTYPGLINDIDVDDKILLDNEFIEIHVITNIHDTLYI